MVNRSIIEEVISKSIDDSLLKSHQRFRLPKGVKSTFDSFASEHHGEFLDDEKGLIVDENGKSLSKRKGATTSVTWDLGEVSLLYELHGDLYMTHTHPNWNKSDFPTCLSEPDLEFPFHRDETGEFMIKNVTAEDTYNGSSMTLIRGDYYDNVDDRDNLVKANKLLHKTYSKSLKKYKDNYQKEFDKLWKKNGSPKNNDSNYDKVWEEVSYQASMNAYNKSGFEKGLVKIQDAYEKANCRLKLEWREV